jgi:hypothetical protein
MQDGLGRGRWRRCHAIPGRNRFFLGGRIPLLAGGDEEEKSTDKKERQETEARDLIHPCTSLPYSVV